MPRRLQQGIAGTGSGGLGSFNIVSNTIQTSSANENITLTPGGTGEVVVSSPLRATNTTSSTNKDTGSLITEGGIAIAGNLYIGGYLASVQGIDNTIIGASSPSTGSFTTITVTENTTLAETTEVVASKTGATGVVVHDFTESNNWTHTSISANFTVNLTNVPTTNDRLYTINLYLVQGATGRLATAFQIDGVAQTIRWAGNVAPTPSNSGFDLETFTVIRSSGSWVVLGSMTTNSTQYPGSTSANPAPSGHWLAQNLKTSLSLTSGLYWIKSPAMPNALQMYVDMVQENGGYDFYPINSTTIGSTPLSVNYVGQTHSGMALGLDIVYPRSAQHWQAMRNYVSASTASGGLNDSGNNYFQTCYAVYRLTGTSGGSRGGNYTGVVMRDPRFYGSGTEDWRTGDGGRWWLRNSTFGEPNGDYAARAFLGLASGGYSHVGYAGGDIGFNDGTASYALGSFYLVSTNAKP